MKVEKQDDDEFEMLLGEIPHATSLPLHHHREQELQHQQHPSPLLLLHHHHHTHHYHHHQYFEHQHQQDFHGEHVDSGHGLRRSPMTDFGPPDADPSCHLGYICASPASRVSLQSEGSSSSSRSGGNESPSPPSVKYQMPPRKAAHCQNGILLSGERELINYCGGRIFNGSGLDELSNKLWKMHLREEEEDVIRSEKLAALGNSVDSCQSWFNRWQPSVGVNHGTVTTSNPFEDGRNGFSNDCGLFECPGAQNSASSDEERRLLMSGLLQQRNVGNLSDLGVTQQFHMRNLTGSCLPPNQLDTPFPYSRPYNDLVNSTPNQLNLSGLPYAPLATSCEASSDVGYLPRCSYPSGWDSQSPSSIRCPLNLEAFFYEDSYVIEGKDFNYVVKNGHNLLREHRSCSPNNTSRGHSSDKGSKMVVHLHPTKMECSPMIHGPPLPQKYDSLMELQGYVYFIAKDQHGCRFLQRKLDEGNPQDIQMIFREIIDHAVELMMNPFGNYLMQKLLDVCTEEQRMQILLVVTEVPGDLVKISLNTHGTRSVQKLIETLKTAQQVSLVVLALESGFLNLIQDLNGNHVVQRCLQCLSNEDNKFIFDAAAKFCVDIATHQHGCCVLQRCISHSTGAYRENLVAEISNHGLLLAQDAFGNYVVQYILELKIPSATANLISQFEGKYVHLSIQKFSSNVVEKCLKVFGEESRSRIIHELLSTSQFEQLLQHPYANYVIQSALLVSKGPLHSSLVEAIRPHAAVLRTSPYCKRIFSRAFLKSNVHLFSSKKHAVVPHDY